MKLPDLNSISRNADYSIEFKGLNHNMYVGENQFYWMENLCATNYPVMTPRAARAAVRTISGAQGIYARGKLCWCAGNKFYYGGSEICAVSAGEKQFVGMGAYVIIFPDGIMYNTVSGAVSPMAASWTQSAAATIKICRYDGSDYGKVTEGATAPSNPAAGDYWLDTSGANNALRVYSNGVWQAVTTSYARISSTGIGAPFKTGDSVAISGAGSEIDGTHEIADKADGYIVITANPAKSATIASGMTVKRGVPQMDFVCELNNRLWGCSSAKHEIYCCKLGDPGNWNKLGTGAGDAWAATVGSDGDFTGACSFGGSVFFWKEDCVHKVMGTKPGNFQIVDSPIRGVQKGSEKSLCVVNESLMYKSRDCVCVYDNGTPISVSDGLGTGSYYNASAGVCGDRYYISMQDEDGAWHMFVFNEAKGMWHREDATHAKAFAALNGQLYFLTDGDKIMAVRGRDEIGATIEQAFDWYAETGDMMVEMADNKYVCRIKIRASVDTGATLKIEAQYDSSGQWKTIYSRGASTKASFTVPLVPMRCDHVRLRISGHGRSAVYAIGKETSRGSEL
jgi:hypothetical protein